LKYFILQFGRAWSFVWGAKPTKPRGDGTAAIADGKVTGARSKTAIYF